MYAINLKKSVDNLLSKVWLNVMVLGLLECFNCKAFESPKIVHKYFAFKISPLYGK